MEDYAIKEMTGSAWYQTNKRSPKAPDLRGKIVIQGHTWEIVGWNKFTPNGKAYVSFSINEPQPQDGSQFVPRGAQTNPQYQGGGQYGRQQQRQQGAQQAPQQYPQGTPQYTPPTALYTQQKGGQYNQPGYPQPNGSYVPQPQAGAPAPQQYAPQPGQQHGPQYAPQGFQQTGQFPQAPVNEAPVHELSHPAPEHQPFEQPQDQPSPTPAPQIPDGMQHGEWSPAGANPDDMPVF